MKAATGGGNTAVAVRGANTSCFITQKKVQVIEIIVSHFLIV